MNKKELTKQYNKQYYAENKTRILEGMNKYVMCECGIEYTHCNRTKHLRTTKHKYNILLKKKIVS
jgi:hypothetical protein